MSASVSAMYSYLSSGFVQVEVFDVDDEKMCSFGWDYAVEQDFGCCQLCGFGADFAGVFDLVTSDGEADVFFIWSVCHYYAEVGWFLPIGDVCFFMKNIVLVPWTVVSLLPHQSLHLC